jgi:NUMOD3 motif
MDVRPIYIYALMEPDLVTVRYVGKTVDLHSRYLTHLCPNKNKRSTHKAKWVASLLRLDQRPVMVELECVQPGGDWVEAERRWIAYYRELGFNLTNHTLGGEGATGAVRSADTRRKIGDAHRGRVVSDGTKAKISASNTGKQRTAEVRARQGESSRGRKHSPESIAKTAESHRGRKRSPETCERISASLRGKKRTDEVRLAMSESRRGRKRSPESVEKTASAHRGMKRSPETCAKLRLAWERRRLAKIAASA